MSTVAGHAKGGAPKLPKLDLCSRAGAEAICERLAKRHPGRLYESYLVPGTGVGTSRKKAFWAVREITSSAIRREVGNP